jgi:pimeloyl-ACP methyl ester carboxylesterase
MAIPRPNTNHIYVIAYNRKVFLDQTPDMYQRPDLQLNNIIDKLTATLRQDGYDIADKVFMDGYSAGGMFTQRYALLHPDRLMAVAGGQCGGSLTVPDMAYDWPVGIRDFEKLTGSAFNENEYRKLPQLYYIGDLDNMNSTAHLGNPDVFTDAQIMTLFRLYGKEDPERLQNQVNQMNDLGFTNVFFTRYPGIKHEYTTQMIATLFQFFEEYR